MYIDRAVTSNRAGSDHVKPFVMAGLCNGRDPAMSRDCVGRLLSRASAATAAFGSTEL